PMLAAASGSASPNTIGNVGKTSRKRRCILFPIKNPPERRQQKKRTAFAYVMIDSIADGFTAPPLTRICLARRVSSMYPTAGTGFPFLKSPEAREFSSRVARGSTLIERQPAALLSGLICATPSKAADPREF